MTDAPKLDLDDIVGGVQRRLNIICAHLTCGVGQIDVAATRHMLKEIDWRLAMLQEPEETKAEARAN